MHLGAHDLGVEVLNLRASKCRSTRASVGIDKLDDVHIRVVYYPRVFLEVYVVVFGEMARDGIRVRCHTIAQPAPIIPDVFGVPVLLVRKSCVIRPEDHFAAKLAGGDSLGSRCCGGRWSRCRAGGFLALRWEAVRSSRASGVNAVIA